MIKKLSLIAVVLSSCVFLTCCGSGGSGDKDSGSSKKIAMVSDVGGINDQSFNQSAWEGLGRLEKAKDVKVSYVESTQSSDFITNLERMTDSGNDLIWAIGYSLSDAIVSVAEKNKGVSYAIADFNLGDKALDNTTSVEFYSEQSSFLVGYIAAKTTKSNKLGFVGGIKCAVVLQFLYGYEAGIKYAEKELGKDIKLEVQYAESFSDSTAGKAIASKMFSDGCDIVFHAAGKVGDGVIAAAVENNKFAIGVDRDQSDKAPNNVLTSAIKNVGKAIELVSEEFLSGKNIGKKVYKYGLKDDCVGIPSKDKSPNIKDEVYQSALELRSKIISGEVVVPSDKESYEKFCTSF